MKSKYELTFSTNYVRNWTYLEAIREFFQNALDEQSANSDHKMNIDYLKDDQMLIISNANSSLDVRTLLLGETSKSNGNYIGSFGEGYKIGILVLLREGKSVTIYNKSDKWTAKLVNSKRYKSMIPVIEIDHNGGYKNNKDLIIGISGISEDEYNHVVENNLFLKYSHDYDDVCTKTEFGDLLTKTSEKGKIYVGGLYVCEDFELKYGYNINPKYVNLNRDRNMISSFDLIWNTSRIIANALKDDPDGLLDSLNGKDTDYIDSFIKTNSKSDLARFFYERYGDRIPVTTQEEFNYFKGRGMNPIIVKEKIKTMIGNTSYNTYYDEYSKKNKSLYVQLRKMIDNPTDNTLNEISNLIEEFKVELSKIECDIYEEDE